MTQDEESTGKKKDLTGILELSESGAQQTGSGIPPSEITTTPPTETVQEFENLDSFTQSQGASSSFEMQVSAPDITQPQHPDHEPAVQFDSTSTIPSMEPALEPDLNPGEMGADAMESVKKFSEQLPVGKTSVQAAYPFSLLITGHLKPEEREKLLDIISRERMGIREVDLEPQFAGGRILIPRISEYAGIMLIQALRGVKAHLKLGPSDSIFATEETRATDSESATGAVDARESAQVEIAQELGIQHPAENMPITPDSKIPNIPHFIVLDTVTASASIKTKTVEAESTAEYQEIVENLQRELKYKAYRKGATAVIHFKLQLSPMMVPTHYKLTVMGSAIKAELQLDHCSRS